MSEHIPHGVVRVVRARAGRICEYCHLPQILQEAAFHIDHISPRSRKGSSDTENLALACVTCSLKKAARTHSRDPLSKELVPLFHPRHDRWGDHFRWSGSKLIGRTPTGRATIVALGNESSSHRCHSASTNRTRALDAGIMTCKPGPRRAMTGYKVMQGSTSRPRPRHKSLRQQRIQRSISP